VEAVLAYRAGRIVDVGTGSGAIAITLALETGAEIIATDISSEALAVAAGNAAQLRARVEFLQTDLLAALFDSSLDLVASNPPYVTDADRATMQREVRDWEPELALFAGDDGLAIYRRLIPEAWRVLRPGGHLALEIGFGQRDAVAELTRDWTDIEIRHDLAGIPRVLLVTKPQ
jgi:release factor glutamine methyltransferase